MPIAEMQKFRQKYPQYNDKDDATLVNMLARKYPEYSDLRDRVGQEPRETLTPKSNVNVALETAKGTAGYIGGRAKGLLKGAVETVKHPVQTAKSFGNLVVGTAQKIPGSPLGTVGRLLPGAKEREKYPKAFVQSVKEDPLGFATDTALTMGAGAAAGRIIKAVPKKYEAVKKGIEQIQASNEELAGRLNNSLIGATQRDVIHGNPGRGIAKEGIKGKSFDVLEKQVSAKLDTLSSQLDDVYAKNPTVINNYAEAIRPLVNARKELMKAPADNATVIRRIDNILQDVTGLSTGKPRKFNMNPVEARQFKQYMDGFADWSLLGKSDSFINKAVKQAYGKIDNILDNSLPQSKLLNERVTDLITAKKLIRSKIQKLSTKEVFPGSFLGMANVPFQFLRGPGFKTNLASVLAKKYPKRFTTEIFEKPLFRGEKRFNLLEGQSNPRLLPSPKSAGYKYNPPGYSVPPIKPKITPYEKTGMNVIEGSPKYEVKGKQPLTAQQAVKQGMGVEEFAERHFSNLFKKVGDSVDGLVVKGKISNQDSISATFGNEYKDIGVREIPINAFGKPDAPTTRVRELANKIKESGEIEPLIVAIGKEGEPYILEGAHRFDALGLLNKKSLPAQVILDTRGLAKSQLLSEYEAVKGATPSGLTAQQAVKQGMGVEEYVKNKTPKGYVTVYHRTNANPKDISEKGFKSLENTNEIFVSNKIKGQAEGYGKNVIELKVKKTDLILDDEFPSGEKHYALKADLASKYLQNKSQLLSEYEAAKGAQGQPLRQELLPRGLKAPKGKGKKL